jgi:hemolysin III
MSHPPHSAQHDTEHEEFSLPLFTATVVGTLAVLFLALRFLAPAVWDAQWLAPLWKGVAAFAVVSLVNCFFEYFFHRYLLHTPALPLVRRLYRQHTLHHALTHIVRRPARDGRAILCVENKFPIVEPEQGEASFFPWYALAVFALFLTPLFALLHLVLPSFPWFFAGYLALACSITLYEVLHAINHWSLDKWSPLLTHRVWGAFWRPVYGFHLRHHAVTDCNESVSGFFGLPVADWAFRTCIIPKTVYANGEPSEPDMFRSPRPLAPIAWLDGLARRSVQRRRAQSAAPSVASVTEVAVEEEAPATSTSAAQAEQARKGGVNAGEGDLAGVPEDQRSP